MYTRRFVALAGLAVLGGLTSAARADVRLELRPLLTQAACVGQEFEVGLFASTTNPELFATGEGFSGIQVILAWDPTVLELMGASTANSPISWSIREFLAGDVAGLNEAEIPKDGDAFYLLTAQLSNNPPRATQLGVLATTFLFKALVQTSTPTAITLLGQAGSPALSTRVSDAVNPGLNILAGSGSGIVSQFAIPVTCTRTLADLEIQGSAFVTAGSSGQCRALASFLEGFTLDVTTLSSWRILSGPGTIDDITGIYTAPSQVQGSVQVTVEATFVDQGTLVTAIKTFIVIEPQDDRNPTGLTLNGPQSVDENGTGQYTATAFFSNSPSADVTSSPGTTWLVIFGPGTISSTGLYFAPSVSQDRQVTVEASFTENGVTVTARKTFIVRDLTVEVPQLTGLTIAGPVLVPVGRTVTYVAVASFSDGSEADVTLQSSWLVLTGPGFFNPLILGEYQAPASVTGPTPVTIQAFFTDSTGSANATLDITVIQPEPAVDLIFRPVIKQGDIGDIFRCELYAVSNADFDQTFHAVEAILTWDPFVLQLIGAERVDSIFSTSGIFPGDPHNCNEADPPADGTALFSGFAPLAKPVIAKPYKKDANGNEIGGTLIAFIVLRAISPGTARVEIIGNGCNQVGNPPRDKRTTVVDSKNPGLNITGILGFSQITVSGDGGVAVVVVSRSPVPDAVLNRRADPNNPANAGGSVSVLFNAPTTNVNIQVVGVRNGAQTGVLTASNGGRTHTLTFSPFLPDRDRYNVTVRVGSVIVSQWSFGKLVGDCNRNGTVDILDAGQLRSALKTGIYNQNCDFDGNVTNDILDLFSLRLALKEGAFLP